MPTLHNTPAAFSNAPLVPNHISPHPPAPPFSIIRVDFPNPLPSGDPDPNPGPIDPFDLTRWRPRHDTSIPPRPRDGEFASFILDKLGGMGNLMRTPLKLAIRKIDYIMCRMQMHRSTN